jgi:hypothetical protein
MEDTPALFTPSKRRKATVVRPCHATAATATTTPATDSISISISSSSRDDVVVVVGGGGVWAVKEAADVVRAPAPSSSGA